MTYGYVHTPGGERAFWGVHTGAPTPAQILAGFTTRDQENPAAEYAIADGQGKNLCFAFPKSWGAVASFYIAGVATVYTRTDITITVLGVDVPYYLYVSPATTAALNIKVKVPTA